MPELPDVTVYLEALAARILGARLERVRLLTPFLLRSVDPPLSAVAGTTVTGLRRLGKRLVIALDPDLFLVIHLMIAGRLHWKPAGARPPGKIGLAAFDFSTGTLIMTEAGTKAEPSAPIPAIWRTNVAVIGRTIGEAGRNTVCTSGAMVSFMPAICIS